MNDKKKKKMIALLYMLPLSAIATLPVIWMIIIAGIQTFIYASLLIIAFVMFIKGAADYFETGGGR